MRPYYRFAYAYRNYQKKSTKGDYWLRRLRIANEEHTKTNSCMRYNEHTHATTNNRYALLAYR